MQYKKLTQGQRNNFRERSRVNVLAYKIMQEDKYISYKAAYRRAKDILDGKTAR